MQGLPKIWSEKPWELECLEIGKEEFFNALSASTFMEGEGGNNKTIPAGYTYFGQFIAHDLSFDPMSNSDFARHTSSSNYSQPVLDENCEPYNLSKRDKKISPNSYKEATKNNFRTPKLDLDSIYPVAGPNGAPQYFDQGKNEGRTHFLLDIMEVVNNVGDKIFFYDLPRKKHPNGTYIPIMVDHRNDENIMISQLHVAFLLLHNRVVQKKCDENPEILYLKNSLKKIKKGKVLAPLNIGTMNSDFQPLEFKGIKLSDANFANIKYLINQGLGENKAFLEVIKIRIQTKLACLLDKAFADAKRYVIDFYHKVILYDYLPKIVGYDMICQTIQDKDRFYKPGNQFFIPLEFSVAAFRFGHSMVKSLYIFNPFLPELARPLDIFTPKPPKQKPDCGFVDWSFFFFIHNTKGTFSNTIIPKLRKTVIQNLPDRLESKNLVFRNIARSYNLGIASGKYIAEEMKKKISQPEWLDLTKINKYKTLRRLEEEFPVPNTNFFKDPPLWFYILAEAYVLKQGKCLGPVGGRIVTEVFLEIFRDSELISLSKFNTHIEENDIKGDNSMIDLLKEAGVYNGCVSKDPNKTPKYKKNKNRDD